jgi:hypothetical protein
MIRFCPKLVSQIVCPTNSAKITSIFNDYNSLVRLNSYPKTPILFVSQVQEVDVVEASYKYFTPRLISVLSSDVWFEFWVRQQSLSKRNDRKLFRNSLVTRIWFDSRNVFAPSVRVLMERGDFDMNYIRSINYQHQFEDIRN